MRLLVDLQACQGLSRFRGIGRFSIELTKALVRQAGNDEVWLALNGNFPDQADFVETQFSHLVEKRRIVRFVLPPGLAEMDRRNSWRTQASELLRESFLQALRPDLVLLGSLFEGWGEEVVTSVGALRGAPPTAVIHYDLIPLLNQESYLSNPRHRDHYYRKLASLQRTDLLLAISEHSRGEAIAALDLHEGSVVNISGAADSCFRPPTLTQEQEHEVLQRYGISRHAVMCAPGGFDPRKNLTKLIEGYACLPREVRADHQLVIASGIHDVARKQLAAAAQSAGLEDGELVLTGYIPDADLVRLYGLCRLFVFPSLHEGFGLPVLEAMSCGAPTIGANATSLVEVIGWSEAMFDPTSAQAICEAMRRALTDSAHRDALRQHALAQASRFSWHESARRALVACRELVARLQVASQASVDMPDPATGYRQLIEALSALKTPVKPTSMDLVLVARAIAENEVIAAQALNTHQGYP